MCMKCSELIPGCTLELLLSGLRMHGTQPKPLLEEDRESGIGSTLDLSSSFEGCRQHTNHQSNAPSLREAHRLPEEKGTRVAWGGEQHIRLRSGLFQKIITAEGWCSLDQDMLTRHSRITQPGQQKAKVLLPLSSVWLRLGNVVHQMTLLPTCEITLWGYLSHRRNHTRKRKCSWQKQDHIVSLSLICDTFKKLFALDWGHVVRLTISLDVVVVVFQQIALRRVQTR